MAQDLLMEFSFLDSVMNGTRASNGITLINLLKFRTLMF